MTSSDRGETAAQALPLDVDAITRLYRKHCRDLAATPMRVRRDNPMIFFTTP